MKPRVLRTTVLALTVLMFLPLFWKGRVTPRQGGGAAFLRYTSGKVLVRMSGDLAHSGIRQINDGVCRGGVINMTIAGKRFSFVGSGPVEERLSNGDILHFERLSDGNYRVTLFAMAASERILLGIPLEPDRMTYEDWLSLPGIGPKLADSIMDDRQKNGRFGSLDAISRVAGIGPGKIEALRKFFR